MFRSKQEVSADRKYISNEPMWELVAKGSNYKEPECRTHALMTPG